MESIGTCTKVAPVARSPLDSARGRRKKRTVPTYSSPRSSPSSPSSVSSEGGGVFSIADYCSFPQNDMQ